MKYGSSTRWKVKCLRSLATGRSPWPDKPDVTEVELSTLASRRAFDARLRTPHLRPAARRCFSAVVAGFFYLCRALFTRPLARLQWAGGLRVLSRLQGHSKERPNALTVGCAARCLEPCRTRSSRRRVATERTPLAPLSPTFFPCDGRTTNQQDDDQRARSGRLPVQVSLKPRPFRPT